MRELELTVEDLYGRLSDEMDRVTYGLESLAEDVRLGERGLLNPILAFDFSCIHDYLYPGDHILQGRLDAIAPREEAMASAAYDHVRADVALHANMSGSRLMLSPHIEELANQLAYRLAVPLRDSLIAQALEAGALSDQSVGGGGASSRGGLASASEKDGRLDQLLKLVSRITIVHAATHSQSALRMRELFGKDGSVGSLEGLGADAVAAAVSASKDRAAIEAWRSQFELCGSETRSFDSNFRDAQAAVMLERVNRHLRVGGSASYLVLVTDAPSAFRVLNWDWHYGEQRDSGETPRPRAVAEVGRDGGAERFRMIRVTETYVFRELFGTGDGHALLTRVAAEMEKLSPYLLARGILRSATGVDGRIDCGVFDMQTLVTLESALKGSEEYLAELKTARIAALFGARILDAAREVGQRVRTLENLLDRLTVGVTGADIEAKGLGLEGTTREQLAQLSGKIGAIVASRVGERLGQAALRFTTFNIVPFGIKFQNASVAEEMRTLTPKKILGDPEGAGEAFARVLQLANEQASAPERVLLTCVLLLAMGEEGAVVRLLDATSSPGEGGVEVAYVRCLAGHRVWRKSQLAEDRLATENGLATLRRIGRQDPRIPYLEGVVWSEWVERGAVEARHGLKRALELFEVALSSSKEAGASHLRARLFNNVAYLAVIARRQGAPDLVDAAKTADAVERMYELPIDEWTPGMHDTALAILRDLEHGGVRLTKARVERRAEHKARLRQFLDAGLIREPDRDKVAEDLEDKEN